MFNRQLAGLHRALSRSRVAERVARKIMNQCGAIVYGRLSDGIDPEVNGEYFLLDRVAPTAEVFIDVGANVGNWSSRFLRTMKKDGAGFLVEPNPAALRPLHALKDKYVSQVHLVEMAASSREGFDRFYALPEAGETSSFFSDFSEGLAEEIEVETTTVDKIMEKNSIEYCDFLKIDVEGFDLEVLRGASDGIRNCRFGVVQFEYNYPWCLAGSTLFEAKCILEKAGYRTFLLKGGGIYDFSYDRYGEFYRYSNFVGLADFWLERLKDMRRGSI